MVRFMSPRRRVGVTLAAVAALMLAGCAGETAPAPPHEPPPFGTHHVDPKDGMPDAQVLGVLTLDDGCLMVELEGDEYPLVLPDVAIWDEQAQEVTIDGRTFAVGDEVWWVGGYGPGADVPDSCPRDAEIARVYETS